MTAAERLKAILDLMQEIETAARPADAVVSAWFRARRQIGDRDRGAISEEIYALMRHHARLGWWLEKHGREATPRNRLLAWLVINGRMALAQVEGLFSGKATAPNGLTDPERTLIGKLQGSAIEHPAMPEEVRAECPAWALEPLRRRFGDQFGREMAALLKPASLDLRVNPLKSDRAAMLRSLRDLGLEAERCPMAPYGIRVAKRPSLSDLPMLKSGAVEIQDEGSQLVALLVAARPGERVVDFCAGAGGKTLAMAAEMANRGHIMACDISDGRLKRAAERFRQAGFHNIQTRLLTSESDKWVKRHKASYDRVLVDAPCSGSGTWRRNPDARWRASEADGLDGLVALQARILASAARLVKPGGRLVYATCSMLPQENEQQVAAFLAAFPAFEAVSLADTELHQIQSAHPDYLSLTPARHDTDGFFAAVLQRKAEPVAG